MIENSSALKKHFLSSILPYQEAKQAEHFLKNKQFYKPEQFIWNNPHRTSKRLYPYYHQFNEEYELKIKPLIEELQQKDRITHEQERIRKLTQLRNETRQKFFQRQKSREELQAKSNSRKKTVSIFDTQSVKSRELSNQPVESLKKSFFKSHSNSNHIAANIEKTYQRGVQQYDSSLNQIRKMVNEQVIQNHFKIRSQFKKRKENNDIFNTSISRIKGRKSVGVMQYGNLNDP